MDDTNIELPSFLEHGGGRGKGKGMFPYHSYCPNQLNKEAANLKISLLSTRGNWNGKQIKKSPWDGERLFLGLNGDGEFSNFDEEMRAQMDSDSHKAKQTEMIVVFMIKN